ncbi:type IV secretion system DNA-binding domain-containing protein [bacterium]|nr:type IV secretion system DNA-binding domain-containing protein [bacterium]
MNPQDDTYLLKMVGFGALALFLHSMFENLSRFDAFLLCTLLVAGFGVVGMVLWDHFSKRARVRKKAIAAISEEPKELLCSSSESISMGKESSLGATVYLPDSLRSKHVHIIGATGSGKTESVILNFIRQDVARGIGSIILDAKGDLSFINSLKAWVPKDKLEIFDLSDENSRSYDPLKAGSAIEAAQRLFSSLTWSEEYYKSKAFSALQRLFQIHSTRNKGKNPKLSDLDRYLNSPNTFAGCVQGPEYPEKLAMQDFEALSGLRDQIKILCLGHLNKILSPKDEEGLGLEKAHDGQVLYFRLQSLLSPQLVGIVGRLLINHLNFLAGSAHRAEGLAIRSKLVPTYLDEFASFACPEFADLISKARSAGFALHFSHQSIGDLLDISKGFISQVTDNSATKIVMRINDPDTADYFARAFGTKLYKKTTQRITNAKDIDRAEILEDGTQREAHQFRASPDVFKTLPTGAAAVLIAHGQETPHGASSVFRIKFPKLETKKEEIA